MVYKIIALNQSKGILNTDLLIWEEGGKKRGGGGARVHPLNFPFAVRGVHWLTYSFGPGGMILVASRRQVVMRRVRLVRSNLPNLQSSPWVAHDS